MSSEQLAQSRAAARKRARIRGLVTLAVLTVALVGVLVAVSRGGDSKASGYKSDDCLSIGGSTVISDATKVACTAPNAAYVVVNKLAGSASCDPSYATYTVTKDDAKSTVEAAYCLRLNGLRGDCFHAGESVVSFTPIAKVACSPTATFRVLKKINGTDAGACGPVASRWPGAATAYRDIVYPQARIVLCLAAPN